MAALVWSWTELLLLCIWAQSCICTIVWVLSCMGTNVSGHKRVWAKRVWAHVCGHKHIWAQSCGLHPPSFIFPSRHCLHSIPLSFFTAPMFNSILIYQIERIFKSCQYLHLTIMNILQSLLLAGNSPRSSLLVNLFYPKYVHPFSETTNCFATFF